MGIRYIDGAKLKNKRVLLRVDFNVSLSRDGLTIADDARIRQSLPTINSLLEGGNKLIIISHLGRPDKRSRKYSLKIVADHLHKLIPGRKVSLIDDFTAPMNGEQASLNEEKVISVLENIRFYPEEKKGSLRFAKELSALGDAYVNDAFGVSHRADASIVGIPKYLSSYGGLLMKKEIEAVSKILERPKKGFVAIIAGAKISTKIDLIARLTGMVEHILIGGSLANAFLAAEGHEVGRSAGRYEEVEKARRLIYLARQRGTRIDLPLDVVIGHPQDEEDPGEVRQIDDLPINKYVLDIGPDTQAFFGRVIAEAKTIVWNGPVGYFENISFRRGTDFIYYAIAHNEEAFSVVGGGDTIAAISKKEYLDKIDHISTGGGAMLEFIEKGTLPGIEALKS